jgi:hypothetical protein
LVLGLVFIFNGLYFIYCVIREVGGYALCVLIGLLNIFFFLGISYVFRCHAGNTSNIQFLKIVEMHLYMLLTLRFRLGDIFVCRQYYFNYRRCLHMSKYPYVSHPRLLSIKRNEILCQERKKLIGATRSSRPAWPRPPLRGRYLHPRHCSTWQRR